jgi:hypothetical protein
LVLLTVLLIGFAYSFVDWFCLPFYWLVLLTVLLIGLLIVLLIGFAYSFIDWFA